MRVRRVVLAEDNPHQADQIAGMIREVDAEAEIVTVASESEFRSFVDEMDAADAVDVCVMDTMLRWALPSPTMPPVPAAIAEAGYYRAGIRCVSYLRDAGFTDIPVVVLTVLDIADLEDELPRANVSYVQKQASRGAFENRLRSIWSTRPRE